MSDGFQSIELVGLSDKGFDEAVRVAVKQASDTVRNLRWLEVMDQRAFIEGDNVQQFQITLRLWFEEDGS